VKQTEETGHEHKDFLQTITTSRAGDADPLLMASHLLLTAHFGLLTD
jgi:hypothetical protein